MTLVGESVEQSRGAPRGDDARASGEGTVTPRRWRDLAVVLPVFGLLLLMPPIIGLFVLPHTLGGVPVIVVYVFGVWAGLIGVAILMCRPLARGRLSPSRRTGTGAGAGAGAGAGQP